LTNYLNLDQELPLKLLDILPTPVLVQNDRNEYIWANEALETLLSTSRYELIGKTGIAFFEENGVKVQSNLPNTEESSESVFQATIHRSDKILQVMIHENSMTLSNGRSYVVKIMHDVTDLMKANDELKRKKQVLESQYTLLQRLAQTDHLTGCLNRRALFDLVEEGANDEKGALLILDIDFFKHINDEHGHDAGDAALVHFTKTIKENLRQDDILARIGGEEFAILLNNATQKETLIISERIRKAVEETPLLHGDKSIKMTVSVGGSYFINEEKIDIANKLRLADQCLYAAKRAGRNQIMLS